MKRIIKLSFILSALFIAAPLWMDAGKQLDFEAAAEPSWARKYNAECTLCHTTYPRLNRIGYEFKRLGYRLPKEVEAGGKGATATQTAAGQAAHKPYVIEPTGYKAKPATPESEQGRAVFEKLNCASCHSIGGRGGRMGPPMDGVGGRRDEEFLIAHLTDPEEHAKKFPELHANQPNRMPHPHATAEEVRLIVAYLLTLPEPAAGFRVNPHQHTDLSDSPPAGDFAPAPMTERARAGQKLYADMGCAACHSIGRLGGQFGPKLDGIGARRGRRWIEGHITNPQLHTEQFPGEHATEPAMPATSATPEQIEQIADFLMTLPEQAEAGATRGWRLPDYIGVSYLPGIEWENSGGETEREFEKREFIIFAAGPVGRNFSFFVQPLPASEEEGFMGKFEMVQGLFNYGGARNFFQARFGQIFNLRNAGFAGTDRGLTETVPFVFQAANGFNPSGLGRGISLEYTLGRTTTFKVFGNYNEAVELEQEEEDEEGEDGEGGDELRLTSLRGIRQGGIFPRQEEEEPLAPEFDRSRNVGFAFEKVLGNKGLSGVQFQFVAGRTPFSLAGIRQRSLRFQRYSFFANKTFLDGKSFERVNAIFGISLLRDDRFFGLETDRRSRGWGYFIEVDTIPIVNHLSLFGRYDQLRPTTLASTNTVRGGTFGVIYDFVKYARMSFEYQRLDNGQAVNRYRLGWQFNF
jgi:mono/diheme cytochrome c family protein